jgi:hypothetical protein
MGGLLVCLRLLFPRIGSSSPMERWRVIDRIIYRTPTGPATSPGDPGSCPVSLSATLRLRIAMRSTLLLAVREGIESDGLGESFELFCFWMGRGRVLTRSVFGLGRAEVKRARFGCLKTAQARARGRVACGSAKSSVRTKRAPTTRDAQHDAPALRIPLAEGR